MTPLAPLDADFLLPDFAEEVNVVVVDNDNRLRFRTVQVLRVDRETVLIAAGLSAGERVVVSNLQVAVDGMRVEPQQEPAPVEPLPASPQPEGETPAQNQPVAS